MKILIVASYNRNRFAPFIIEQAQAIRNLGNEVDIFGIQGKGLFGYLKNLLPLKRKISLFQPDIVHAHFGLSGLLACLQRNVSVVITFHGSDIDEPRNRRLSKLAMKLDTWNIFVSIKNQQLSGLNSKFSIIPCGINLLPEMSLSRHEARLQLGLNSEEKYILFSSAFDNQVKNPQLAFAAIEKLKSTSNCKINFIELKNLSRQEVAVYMCAADVLLMTSHHEGSPQVIKEAMACGCPIVSVDVGDVRERTKNTEGCYISDKADVDELVILLNRAMTFTGKTEGKKQLIEAGLTNDNIARQLISIYTRIVNSRMK